MSGAVASPLVPGRALTGVLLLLLLVMPVSAGAAAASPASDEARFLRLINLERSARGLQALSMAADLSALARKHARAMIRTGDVYHNLALPSQMERDWDALGENVGDGFDVDGLHRAMMESPTHRHQILKPVYSEAGIGVAWDGAVLYVVEDFVRPNAPRAPSAPVPATTSPIFDATGEQTLGALLKIAALSR